LESGAAVETNLADPPHLGTDAVVSLVLTHAVEAAIPVSEFWFGVTIVIVPVKEGLLLGASVSVIVRTNSVVATSVLLVPMVGVGAITVPVNSGLSVGAAPTMSTSYSTTSPV
jgi:hypothetical protein